jgi:integrase
MAQRSNSAFIPTFGVAIVATVSTEEIPTYSDYIDHTGLAKLRAPCKFFCVRIATQKTVFSAPPGRHRADPGLYLIVTPTSCRWVARYTKPSTGRVTEHGLGSAKLITLAEAREKAHDFRRMVARGEDPVELKRNHRRAGVTFAEIVDSFIAINKEHWRSTKHYESMRLLLQTYASPLATKPVSAITSDDIESVVRNASQQKRLLGAIRQVFDLAISKGHCSSNPADRRIMKYRFPGTSNTQHFKALDYPELPDLVQRLRARQQPVALSPYAIEFLILTVCRVNEVTQMRWDEINWTQATWTIPAYRTKSLRNHRVPLSDRPLELLKQHALQQGHPGNGYVWSNRHNKPITNKALYVFLVRYLNVPVTLHGFRSTFRNWCAEQTDFDFQLCEMCLAHSVGDATVRAYLRGDALERRRELMQAWAIYCGSAI